jgi:cytochrome c2
MNNRSFAIAAILISLLGLGASMVSCNDGNGEDAPQTATSPTDTARDGAAPPAAAEPESAADADTAADTAAADVAEEPAPQASSAFITGEGVYKAANCEMCHGKELQGSNLAPELTDLAANWEAAALAEYLIDPEGYTENDVRLKANSVQYKLPMPAWKQTGLGEPDLDLLVGWLLEQE